MGVPAFFRWLSDKFPRVASKVIEELPKEINGNVMPVDTTQPNPNGEEFDNLYLDMNGIIHPCCHPEGKPAPATEDDMMIEVFAYLDRIVDIVRPRQVLYMAIDGVAPRAKMNQQRSRRFRAAQLAEAEREAAEKVENQLKEIGQEHQLPEKKAHFDSNCITPGTPFMAHLATCLRYHIAAKQNSDPLWKNLKVILSDATVPGEGEHKVMEFIRVQRSRPQHNPNTSHVIYGLDADLIMLALGTHEPRFKVLREDVFFQDKNTCRICNKPGHYAAQCTANAEASGVEPPKKEESGDNLKPYVFLHVNILREYLEHALKFDIPGIPWSLERAIDDWVFMCFFVGNDFLPHLPSLEIREGAISTLSILWKQCLPMMGGYMTNNGDVDLKRVQVLVSELGKSEDEIFNERRAKEERRTRNAKRRKLEREMNQQGGQRNVPTGMDFGAMTAMPVNQYNSGVSNSAVVSNRSALRTQNQSAAAALRAELLGQPQEHTELPRESSDGSTALVPEDSGEKGTKRKASEMEQDDEDEDEDDAPSQTEETDLEARGKAILDKQAADKKAADQAARDREPDDAVRLWESGWKDRYYRLKFGIELSDQEAIRHIVKSYCEGLVWVFKYYYKGCASWSWYYPYYYAPMASDFVNIDSFDITFEESAPLKPFEQLMGVLPAASRSHIPAPFHTLMTDEEVSPIIDYYPTDFEVDMDGKKFAWQGVVKLPFIETKRLLDAMAPFYDQLTEEELIRNTEGPSILYVEESHKLYNSISTVYTKRMSDERLPVDTNLSSGMTGTVDKDAECIPRSTLRSPLPNHDLSDIANDKSISVTYQLPDVPKDFVFSSNLLRGVKADRNILGYDDIQAATFEKTYNNNNRRGNFHSNNNRGWSSQIDQMEDYRDRNNYQHQNRNNRGGYGGGGRYDGGYGGNNAGGYGYNNNYNNNYGGYGVGGYGGANGGYGDSYGGGYQGNNQQQQYYNQGGYGGNGGYNNNYRGGGGYNNNNYNNQGRGGHYQPRGGARGGRGGQHNNQSARWSYGNYYNNNRNPY
ncbi:XRN 5'-3' exonuclease N-terminus-domain-containing protein [Zychaea mexicana]|uniref:XRN 5'-3' exonuclease N-terminus-domain-containing protein n=1 Tax=Zychaea mexicana TaxID=64656 RepID=UPI0022FE2F5B|nr:XRN 5'-3' exonuclease N-terminus-domain-containing protein [Zychaea mexicana]KAI9496125.1 XRN 5'-3' exonuclease N-terminus-domain-containing protein [Zychaea mexicana]